MAVISMMANILRRQLLERGRPKVLGEVQELARQQVSNREQQTLGWCSR
jgi:hypothetical protein